MKSKSIIVSIVSIVLLLTPVVGNIFVSGFNTSGVAFEPTASEADLINIGAPFVTFGNTTVYIGYRQISVNNVDPIISSYTNGVLDWSVTDYDTSPNDGRGTGLGWNQTNNRLYAAFSVNGGSAAGSYTRFNDPGRMDNGWLNSYGQGGAVNVGVVYEIDPTDGTVLGGTYMRSQLANGNTNFFMITDFAWQNGDLVVIADIAYTPLRPDKTLMVADVSMPTPLEYRAAFDPNLQTMNSAEVIGFDGVTEFTIVPEPAHFAGLLSALVLAGVLLRRPSRR